MNSLGIEFFKKDESINEKLENLSKQITNSNTNQTQPQNTNTNQSNPFNFSSLEIDFSKKTDSQILPLKQLVAIALNLNQQIPNESKVIQSINDDPIHNLLRKNIEKMKVEREEREKSRLDESQIEDLTNKPKSNQSNSNLSLFERVAPLKENVEEMSLMFSIEMYSNYIGLSSKERCLSQLNDVCDNINLNINSNLSHKISASASLKEKDVSNTSNISSNHSLNNSFGYMNNLNNNNKSKIYTPFKKQTVISNQIVLNQSNNSQNHSHDETSLSFKLNQISNINENNKELVQLCRDFDYYFSLLYKYYFTYILTSKFIEGKSNISIDSSEKVIYKKRLFEKLTKEISISLSSLVSKQSTVDSKMKLYDLVSLFLFLFKSNTNSPSLSNVVSNSIFHYQNVFKLQLCEEEKINPSQITLKTITQFTSKQILSKTLSHLNTSISSSNTNTNSKFPKQQTQLEKSKLEFWGCVYFLLRSGLDSKIKDFFDGIRKNVPEYCDVEFLDSLQYIIDFNLDCYLSSFSYSNEGGRKGKTLFSTEELLVKYEYLLNKFYTEPNKNPYEYASMSIILQLNSSNNIDLTFISSIEEYFWFNLKMIQYKPQEDLLNSMREMNFSLPSKKFNLYEFQSYVIYNEKLIENETSNQFDLVRFYFSIGLFRSGVNYLYKRNDSLVDVFNLTYILFQSEILFDISNTNQSFSLLEIEENEKEASKRLMDEMLNRFVHEFDKVKTSQILFYLISNSMLDCPIEKGIGGEILEGNYLNSYEKSSGTTVFDLILQKNVNKDVFKKEYPNYINIKLLVSLCKNTNLAKSLISDDAIIYDTIKLSHIIPFKSLFQKIIHEIVKLYTSLNKPTEIDDVYIELCRKYDLYDCLLRLLIINSIYILRQKTPSQVYNIEIHFFQKQNKTKIKDETLKSKILKDYKTYFDYFNQSLFSQQDMNNYKFLVQMINIEKIYGYIDSNLYLDALKEVEYISEIPIFGELNDGHHAFSLFISKFEYYDTFIKEFLPEVLYLFGVIFLENIVKLKKNTMFFQKNIDGERLRLQFERIKSYSKNLDSLIHRLNDKYKEVFYGKVVALKKIVSEVLLC